MIAPIIFPTFRLITRPLLLLRRLLRWCLALHGLLLGLGLRLALLHRRLSVLWLLRRR